MPKTRRGKTCILTLLDLFTKYAAAVPIADQRAVTVIRALDEHWVQRLGAPRKLHSDQGTNFESQLFNDYLELWHIEKTRSTGYHPHGNGACERLNQTLKQNLARLKFEENERDWDEVLPAAVFAYNTTQHSSTTFTPFFLTYGEEARMPAELLVGLPRDLPRDPPSYAHELYYKCASACESARKALKASQVRNKTWYDQGATERVFRKGDQVYLRWLKR